MGALRKKLMMAIDLLFEAILDHEADEPPPPKKPAPVLTLIVCNPEGAKTDSE